MSVWIPVFIATGAPAGVVAFIYNDTENDTGPTYSGPPFELPDGPGSGTEYGSFSPLVGDKIIIAYMDSGAPGCTAGQVVPLDGLGSPTGDSFSLIASGAHWKVFGCDLAHACAGIEINNGETYSAYGNPPAVVCGWILRGAKAGFGASSIDYCQFDTTLGGGGASVDGLSIGPGAALTWDHEAVLYAIAGNTTVAGQGTLTTDSPWTMSTESIAADGYHGFSGFWDPTISLAVAGNTPSVPLHGSATWGSPENFLLALRCAGA